MSKNITNYKKRLESIWDLYTVYPHKNKDFYLSINCLQKLDGTPFENLREYILYIIREGLELVNLNNNESIKSLMQEYEILVDNTDITKIPNPFYVRSIKGDVLTQDYFNINTKLDEKRYIKDPWNRNFTAHEYYKQVTDDYSITKVNINGGNQIFHELKEDIVVKQLKATYRIHTTSIEGYIIECLDIISSNADAWIL